MRTGLVVTALLVLLAGCSTDQKSASETPANWPEDFSSLVALNAYPLDAENLAEEGVADAYAEILPELKVHAPSAQDIKELFDQASGRYEVQIGSRRYQIVPSPHGGNEYESWGLATFALFDIVNSQLAGSGVKFYAINAGHDLQGLFLTPEQVNLYRAGEGNDGDRPYIPTDRPPLFGQPVNGS